LTAAARVARRFGAHALVLLAACGSSDAAPGAGSAVPVPPGVTPPFMPPKAAIATPPAGWIAMPSVATAAIDALGGGPTASKGASAARGAVTGDAWGEPAMGCYAVAVGFAAHDVKALLADVKAQMSVRDVVEPPAQGGVLAFTFEKAPWQGRVRAILATGEVTALACFWNDREPVACEAACVGVLGSLK
ncbi:MAG TPA: hypothetical protein VLT45_04645, partial [Kofleriaceae bacterium]|nr:hypothetical protein [Kofleriaceae bacterium]